ncbi:hypothetical protein F5X98DRAFT_41922 [Xylaria grammica]|nr:hypothetical protein F5X98DRAFT_41922 [Xylaria grammica]
MAAQSGPAPALEPPEPPARASAPYGQACVNCVKAKCKCILLSPPSSGAGRESRPTCERCARLGRECKPSSGVRRRRAAGSRRTAAGATPASTSSGTSAATRAANLEQKLEDLVAILKAQTSSTATPTNISSQPEAGEAFRQRKVDGRGEFGASLSATTDRRSTSSNHVASNIASGRPAVVTPASTSYATGSTANSTPSPLRAPAHDILMSAHQAEETLTFFRRHHLKFFPFVYLPPDMTAARLQRDRPYLWLNIRAICCRSPRQQAVISRQSREEIARRLLVDCERNMDMLLGTLCYLGWTMHLCFKPGLCATMSIATSIVNDLRLDKPTHDDDPRIIDCFKSVDFVKSMYSTVRTMEERRATMACYVFCSSGSGFLRCPSMRWTPHMEDSLKILADSPEWEGDQILVLMVRIRRLIDNIMQSQTPCAGESDGYGTLKPPVNIYIKYFYQCLQTIKDQLPPSLKDDRLAESIILSAEMVIGELPFPSCASSCHPLAGTQQQQQHADTSTRAAAPLPARPIDMARIERYFATLQTSKAFFEHFLTFELADFVGFSFPVLLNFFRAAQILYRLRVMDEPGWDRAAVTDRVDLVDTMDVVANRFDQISGLYGFLTETDAEGNEMYSFYVKCTRTFIGTLAMWRAHFAQADAPKATTGAGTGAGAAVAGDAAAGGAAEPGPQVPQAMMGAAGLSHPNLGGRVNYPGMNNFVIPELFPMDFSVDDSWYNEMFSWDTSVFGPIQ